ncbi:hypothetical protein B0A48_05377 [Cryoendolithus antarcticus]|uniref:Uncharacterized protein n=1 Tax=Cryoendolithus antarcticus TaxID=1507870 RepID=A0A1V8TIS0_9PEZI|nr:hypothetical protein B0A48_05377 [Cryoendolithus antarcticus]
MKRTRANPDGVKECTRHIVPANEPTIQELAAQNGCRSSEVLAGLCAELPQSIHPVFNLEYLDVLGLTLSGEQRHGKAASAKPDLLFLLQESNRNDFLLTRVFHEAGAPSVEAFLASTVVERTLILERARQRAIEAVKPAFRLASAILCSDNQLPFWHGIQRAGKRAGQSGSPPEKIPTFITKTDFTAEDKTITLDFLRELGKGIFISFCDTGRDFGLTEMAWDHDLDSYWGRRWLSEPRLPHDRRPCFARVELSVHMYLLPLLRWREATVTQLRRMYLGLAITMLHELAHVAAGYAFRHSQNDTARCGDIYFRGGPVAEIGWSYETYAFGGGVEIPPIGLDPASLFDWPCPQTVQGYQNRGCCAPRGAVIPVVGSSGNVAVEAIDRFFRGGFWRAAWSDELEMPFRLRRCCSVELYNKHGDTLTGQEDAEQRRLLKKRKLGP